MSATRDTDPILIGHYAGAATRFVAFAIDVAISFGIFNVTVAATIWLVGWFTPWEISSTNGRWWWVLGLTAWEFVYFWYCYILSGKTPGKAFMGLRVVDGDGSDVGSGQAALRVVTFPLSWICFGLGFVGIVFGRHRRALHDVIADTAVVYDFDARAAHLRFLARRTTDAQAEDRADTPTRNMADATDTTAARAEPDASRPGIAM